MTERTVKQPRSDRYETCYVCDKCGYGSKEKVTNKGWAENHENNCNGVRPVKTVENKPAPYRVR